MIKTEIKRKIKIAVISILAVLAIGTLFHASFLVRGQDEDTTNEEVRALNLKIKENRERIEAIQKKQEEYNRAIKAKQAERADLSNQLAILDNRIAKAELDIESVSTDIDRTGLEIDKTNLEIKDKEAEILTEKEHISAVLRLLYKQDQASALEVLLLNNSLTEFLNQIKYLEDINSELSEGVTNLEKYTVQLGEQRAGLEAKNQELSKLKKDLEAKQAALNGEKDSKFYLMEATRDSEREYQRLLAAAKQEQANAAADIVSLERQVREKLSQAQKEKLEFNDAGMVWPVPKNVITATFHDPDYPFRYIFEHPAIDIRAPQGTTVKSAASGYVARAKDAGKGYSYIMIIHGNGLATVYGHVSRIFVAEDEYVVQGQAIGLSGGLPGTPGAGRLTTGAHLHFEVRKDGIPTDPMDYLP